MSNASSQVLFLGELPFWLKLSQSIVEAPSAPFHVHRSPSLRDALRRLDAEEWQALLLDLSHPSAQELLAARKLHDGLGSVPLVALLPIADPQFESAASLAGAACSIVLSELSAASLQHAVVTAINSTTLRLSYRKGTNMTLPLEHTAAGSDRLPSSKLDAISHAINNLLCVINANADILTDQLDSTHNGVRSVSQIKKATKSAADLMRLLKTP
jgi:DNA-binding NarL/FixJ family response regulator